MKLHALILGGVLLGACPALGQIKQGAPIKGFKLADDEQGRRRSLLTGSEAILKSKDLWEIKGLKLQTFRANGEVEMNVEAPSCLYDLSAKSASSSGSLKAFTGDGRLQVEGVGFEWQQADNRLVISNQVRTVLSPPTNNASASLVPGKVQPPITVTADQFEFNSTTRLVNYRGSVKVVEPRIEMTCAELRVTLAAQGGSPEAIQALRDVVIVSASDGARITGGRADFTSATDQLKITEHPRWIIGPRQGSADELILDRESRRFRGRGRAVILLPRESLGGDAFALEGASSKQAGMIELQADQFSASTNRTILTGNVRASDPLAQPPSRLACDTLTMDTSGAGASASKVVAEGHVSVEQGDRRIAGIKATYDAATAIVEFLGPTQWQWDERSGSAERILFDRRKNAFTASVESVVRLPLRSLGRDGFIPPALFGSTNVTGSADRWLEIHSEEFASLTNEIYFRGGVTLKLPGDGGGAATDQIKCQLLRLTFGASNKLESFLAHKDLEMTSRDATGRQLKRVTGQTLEGRADPAKGTIATMTLDGGVALEQGEVHAAGDKAVYTAADETVRLTGSPTASTPQMRLTEAEVFIWNWKENRFSATGKWKAEWRRPGPVANKNP